jgi:hypothetical protein
MDENLDEHTLIFKTGNSPFKPETVNFQGREGRGGAAEVAADQQHPADHGQHPAGLG